MANKITIDTDWDTQIPGLSSDDDVNASAKKNISPSRGIFAAFPGGTPKYARNIGEEENDFRETMARMFLQVTDYKAFIDSFAGTDSYPIATVLGGTATEKSGTSGGAGYIDFLLQNVQHNIQEKFQVVETLADDHVAYFFGQAAPVFAYSGTLINTLQDDQAMNMLRLYRDMGRGSKLAARKTLISIRYDGLIVSGAMTNLTFTLSAEAEIAVPFSFNLLVKKIDLLPQEYASVTILSTPFAVSAYNTYQPFSTGAEKIDTAYVRPTATPSLAPVPEASAATEPKPAATETQPQDYRDKLHAQATSKGEAPSKASQTVLALQNDAANLATKLVLRADIPQTVGIIKNILGFGN